MYCAANGASPNKHGSTRKEKLSCIQQNPARHQYEAIQSTRGVVKQAPPVLPTSRPDTAVPQAVLIEKRRHLGAQIHRNTVDQGKDSP